MNENTEQRVGVTIQPLAGVPGVPGATPIYLEEFPAETSNNTTSYDSKNAIWNSGTKDEGYRTISFAGNDRGIQLRAETRDPNPTSQPGVPGHITTTNIFARVKRSPQAGYLPWEELYHTGNLNPSKFLTTANLNAKADKTYVDSALASNALEMSLKAEKIYVDNALATKAEKTTVDAKADRKYVDEGLKTKINYDTVANEFTDVWNNIQALNSHITGINNRLSNLESKH